MGFNVASIFGSDFMISRTSDLSTTKSSYLIKYITIRFIDIFYLCNAFGANNLIAEFYIFYGFFIVILWSGCKHIICNVDFVSTSFQKVLVIMPFPWSSTLYRFGHHFSSSGMITV